jgi:hypothetical protein
MYRTFNLDRIRQINSSFWHSDIIDLVTTHLDHTDELRTYGYSKTNLSNAEKTIYYSTTYKAIYDSLLSIRADHLHVRLAEVDEMIRKVNVEFHNCKYLDNSVDAIEHIMTADAKKLITLINLRMIIQPGSQVNVEINEMLTAMRNKISVQCGIIVYGMIEPIESIDDDDDTDDEMAVIRKERDDAIAELIVLRTEFNQMKSAISIALNK